MEIVYFLYIKTNIWLRFLHDWIAEFIMMPFKKKIISKHAKMTLLGPVKKFDWLELASFYLRPPCLLATMDRI